MTSSNTHNQYQSAYRKFHSTESALIHIHKDFLPSMDALKVTALTLLDLSAAFCTTDPTIILRWFHDWFGVARKLCSNKGFSLSVPRIKTNTDARAFHSCAPSLWKNLPLCLSVQPFSCYLQEISEGTSLWLDNFPIVTSTPDIPLLWQNCFLTDSAVVPLSLAS